MTTEEIRKLATELAKDWIEVNCLPNCLGNEVLSGMAKEMERVVRFILRTHCIVEKSKEKEAEEVISISKLRELLIFLVDDVDEIINRVRESI